MCCEEPNLVDMLASGTWGKYCTHCHAFIPEEK